MDNALMLAPWIAGRYCQEASVAILFNNLLSETYLFEDQTAALIGQLLKYDYSEPLSLDEVAERIGCKAEDIVPFSEELKRCFVLIDNNISETEIRELRKKSALNKKQLLSESNGTKPECIPILYFQQFIARANRCSVQYSHVLLAR